MIENLNEYPWLVFKIFNVNYAVSSKNIISITLLPKDITKIPEQKSYIRGVIEIRDIQTKVTDLRTLFNIPSIESQIDIFNSELDLRKQDHIDWVVALKKYLTDNIPFTLATNHHSCKLGKWYDTYTNKNNHIMSILHRMDTPHEEIHKAYDNINLILNSDLSDNKKEKETRKLLSDVDSYKDEIIKVLTDTQEAFKNSITEMVIAFDIDGKYYAINVDEVLSTDELIPMNNSNDDSVTFKNKFVKGAATAKKLNSVVLLFDEEHLKTLE
ncbi:MAG: chemotaxis protein CheW [Oscillospiraceae bacterium]